MIIYSDINECEDTLVTVNCTQKCINTFGSYQCACYDGYQVTNDTMQCIGNVKNSCYYLLHNHCQYCVDINECEGYNDCHHTCINTEGSYYCSCDTGFSLSADNRSCTGNSDLLSFKLFTHCNSCIAVAS